MKKNTIITVILCVMISIITRGQTNEIDESCQREFTIYLDVSGSMTNIKEGDREYEPPIWKIKDFLIQAIEDTLFIKRNDNVIIRKFIENDAILFSKDAVNSLKRADLINDIKEEDYKALSKKKEDNNYINLLKAINENMSQNLNSNVANVSIIFSDFLYDPDFEKPDNDNQKDKVYELLEDIHDEALEKNHILIFIYNKNSDIQDDELDVYQDVIKDFLSERNFISNNLDGNEKDPSGLIKEVKKQISGELEIGSSKEAVLKTTGREFKVEFPLKNIACEGDITISQIKIGAVKDEKGKVFSEGNEFKYERIVEAGDKKTFTGVLKVNSSLGDEIITKDFFNKEFSFDIEVFTDTGRSKNVSIKNLQPKRDALNDDIKDMVIINGPFLFYNDKKYAKIKVKVEGVSYFDYTINIKPKNIDCVYDLEGAIIQIEGGKEYNNFNGYFFPKIIFDEECLSNKKKIILEAEYILNSDIKPFKIKKSSAKIINKSYLLSILLISFMILLLFYTIKYFSIKIHKIIWNKLIKQYEDS